MDPLVGSMLGKDYRVLEPIGLGGMAIVYLVEHQTLLKRFAAKVLSVELAANLEARARFTQEAHAASQLDHENIVNISDFGVTSDQRPFFVMELLRGHTLDQRIAQGAMSIEEVVAVAVPVARALAHAHAEGIVHRDVKPENVFLVQRSQGRFGVKVVDFGIAKTPINTRLTKMGETLGSPMYMSPEACRGDDVDHRADLYSFGVLLYLMLCGRPPFEHENLLKVLQMQVSDQVPPPRSLNPDISPALAAVIERALAKDPADRHASMDALLVELEAAVPAGSNRLLVETQTGGASSFRITAITGQAYRIGDSQQLARVASQPVLGQVGPALPATTSADTMRALPGQPGRRWWPFALPLVGLAAFGAWLATARDGARPPPAPEVRPAVAAPAPAIAVAAPDAAPAPVAETMHLQLTTTPDGATVTLDGKRLGATPLDVALARHAGDAQLVVSRDGFTEVRQRLDLGEDRSVSLVLAPIVRAPKLVRRPAPPPPPARREPPPRVVPAPAGDPNLDIRMSR